VTRWAIWGLLLVLTNAAGTLSSRARNTPSYGYHGATAFVNHAVWFVVNVMFVGAAVDIGRDPGLAAAGIWAYYACCSTVGSIAAQWIGITFLERGRRRVGTYGDDCD
jgi:hypothetical protein